MAMETSEDKHDTSIGLVKDIYHKGIRIKSLEVGRSPMWFSAGNQARRAKFRVSSFSIDTSMKYQIHPPMTKYFVWPLHTHTSKQ